MDYKTFLNKKDVEDAPSGLDVDISELNGMMFPFQKAITKWGLKRGRAAVFLNTGLGKSLVQLDWCRLISEKTNKPIACCKPFIAFSTPYFLEDVRQLGFETFSPYINESYDLETDNQKRLNMIVEEIKRITNLSADEYVTLVENCHSIAVRNQQKLLSKKDNLQYNKKFNFLRDYFEPQSNIQIL